MNKKTQKPKKKHWIFRLILGGIILKIFTCLFKRRKDIACNLKDFLKEEKREIKELKTGKENFKKYCGDSCFLFFDYFIPSNKNNHKPKILRPHSLAIITATAVAVKVVVVAYLFLIYPNQAMMSDIIVKLVFELTNQSREESGLNTLVLNSVLSASAQDKANDMLSNNYFAHHSPEGVKPWDWINREDYPYIFVGENLAMNFIAADSVHKALMNSPSHKKNILNERYTDIGLAMLNGDIDGKNTNILVELFATTGSKVTAASASDKKTNVTTSVAKAELVPQKPIVENVSDNTESKVDIKPVQNNEVSEEKEIVETSTKVQSVQVDASSMRESQTTDPKKEISQSQVIEDNQAEEFIDESADYDLNTEIVYMTPEENRKFGIAALLVRGSHYIYTGLIMLMIALLIINILVRFAVQHKPVILQSLFVILFIFSLASVKLHFMESIVSKIALL